MVATAHADREFDLRFSADATGSIAMIANTNMTCSTASGATGSSTCVNARNADITTSVNSPNDWRNNNAHTSAYIDVDSDSSTFNSSTANQNLPAGSTILFAGLYWGGHYTGASSPANASLRNQVQFKVPGASSYTTVTSSTLDDGVGANSGRYQAFADVTALLKTLPNGGNGTYAVGNIQSAIGSDRYAGWSLIVAYKNPNETMKNMTIFDGLVSISGTVTRNINISGFLTPPAGPINAQAGFVTWEGDLGLNGDRAAVNGQYMSDAQHPSTNFFDSRISHNGTLFTDRNPAYPNSLGMDAAWTEPPSGSIGNSDTSATITVNSTGDQYLPGVIAFQVEIFSPDIKMEKEALDADGDPITTLAPGDTITYRIAGTNTGQDGTTDLVVTDPIPANTTYVPGSLKIVTNDGSSTGAQTDASGDDLAEFDSGNNLVRYRLGQGANATTGGNLAPDKSYEVTFQVTVNGSTADGTDIHNEARSTMRSQTADIELEADADADVEVVNKQADLQITKTASVDEITPGENFNYTFVVKNNGPADATGVEVTDSLPAGVSFVSSDDCDNSGQDLTCAIGALASGDSVTLTVTVKAAAGLTGTVVNTATVDGDQDDPTPGNNSSTDETPTAPEADLAVVKTVTSPTPPANVKTGGTITWQVVVTNNGPSNATGVTLTDSLPAGVEGVSVASDDLDAGDDCSLDSGTLTCAVGDLAVGGSATVTVSATVKPGQSSLKNTAAVDGDQDDPKPNNNEDETTTGVTPQADLAIEKGVDVDPTEALQPGQIFNYSFEVTNNGPDDATGVEVTDSLPAGVSFVSSDDCDASGQDLTCEVGALAAGDSVTLTVKVKAGNNVAGEVTNVAYVDGDQEDPDLSNNEDSVTVISELSADLGVTKKTVSPDEVKTGDTVVWEITVTNYGLSDATGVTVTDTLPAGVEDAAVSSDDIDAGDCSINSGETSCPVGDLAAGESVVITVTAVVKPGQNEIENLASVTGNQPDPNPDNDTDKAEDPVTPQVDLGIVKTASVDEITPGENYGYTFVVTNNGPDNATGVEVTDSLPAGITYVSSDDCDNSGQDLTCEVGALASGDSVTLTVTVKAGPGLTGTVVNTANVDGDQDDPTPGNNESTDETPTAPEADLGIVKKASVSEITPGETFVYTFNVTNNGPSNVTGITVTDTLPAGVTYVDGAPGCNASGQVVTCTIHFLASGGSAQTGISVRYDGNGTSVVNTAAVGSDLPDPNPDNDESTDETPVQQKADVEIVKTVDNTNPSAGDTVTYKLTVTNNGPGAAKNVIVTDSLPDGVTFVSADAPCVESNGDISCELGTLAAGETVELEIKVTVDAWTPVGAGDAHGIDVQKVETQIDLNPGETRTVQAECPAGYIVSDGSVRVDHIDQGTGSWLSPEVTESRAVNSHTWQGTVTNTASGRAQAKIFAVCIGVETAEVDGHTHTITVNAPVTETVTLEANGQATAVLECPDGTIATQPGFVADAAGHMSYSQPEGNGWKFVYDVGSDADSNDEVTFSIACLERTLSAADDGHTTELQLQRIWTEQVIQPGQVHEVQLICPDGSKGIVGGWDLDPGLYSLGNDPRPVTRAFKVYNPTDEPLTARFSLLCLGDRTVPVAGDGPAITNVGEVETSTTETDTDNNRSSVTIHPAGDGTVVPDGNGKPSVNNPTDRDDHRPGNKPAGMATTFQTVGNAWARNGKANFRVRSNGWIQGNAKLVTQRRVRIGNRVLRRGAVLARGSIRINRAGVTRLRVNLTRQGRRAVRHRRVIRQVRVMVTGKNAGVTRLVRR